MPRVQPLAEVQAGQVASLAVGLGLLQEGLYLFDTPGSAQELNQLRECIEVIRILVKQLAVSANGVLVLIVHEHEIGIHESGLFVGGIDLE